MKTPETDHEFNLWKQSGKTPTDAVPADFCRSMERERDDAFSEVERLTSDRNCEKRMRQDAEEARENLAAEVETLKSDKARMDWASENINLPMFPQSSTLREAIDFAIKGAK